MTATTAELIARERVAFVLYKQAHPESVAESFETVGLPIVLQFRERADAVIAHLDAAVSETEWGTEIRDNDGELIDRDIYESEDVARKVAGDFEETLIKRYVSPWVEVTP